jgi:hypothetical protein
MDLRKKKPYLGPKAIRDPDEWTEELRTGNGRKLPNLYTLSNAAKKSGSGLSNLPSSDPSHPTQTCGELGSLQRRNAPVIESTNLRAPGKSSSESIETTRNATEFAMRYSGLQREVLSLYRKCLRESRKKDAVSRGELCLEALFSDGKIECEATLRVLCKVSRSRCSSGGVPNYS